MTTRTPKRRRRIEQDTPLMPVIIADGLVETARVALAEDLPESLSDHLASKAQVLYQRDEGFARMLHGKGNEGRDGLRAHMREWLVEKLRPRHPTIDVLLKAPA